MKKTILQKINRKIIDYQTYGFIVPGLAGKRSWACVCPAICPSGVTSLTDTLDARLIFFMIFAFFVENHLLGNTKLSILVQLFKNYRPCRQRTLHFSLFFAFFVENHLLGNTNLRFLVLWFQSYWPCRQRTLYFPLFFAFVVENH